MATKATPVTEAEKDEPNVQAHEIDIPGVGPVMTYLRVEQVDDLTGKAEEGIETIQLTVPVRVKVEVIDRDAEGDPIKNGDGTDKITTDEVTQYDDLEIDLSSASLAKLMKALEPFRVKAREVPKTYSAPAPTRSVSKSSNPERTEWTRRARVWLERNRKELGVTTNDRGRLGRDHQNVYVTNNPNDPKP